MRLAHAPVFGLILFCGCDTAPTSTDPLDAGELLATVGANNCVSVNPTTGIVGWWPGDVDATDIRGGFHGTLVNGASAGAAGRADGAFDLTNGDQDYIELPPGVAQATYGDMTIEAWINPVGSRPQIGATLYEIFMRGWDGDGGWGADLVRHTNDHVSFRIVPPPYTSHYDISSQRAITLGEWHHVVGVRRGGAIEIWLDGEVNSMPAPTGPLRGAGRSYIGMDRFRLVNTDYDGLIDEVAIWNTALPSGTITALYYAGRPAKCKN